MGGLPFPLSPSPFPLSLFLFSFLNWYFLILRYKLEHENRIESSSINFSPWKQASKLIQGITLVLKLLTK